MPLNVFFVRKGNGCLAQVRAAETPQVRSRVVQIHHPSVCDWEYGGGDYTEGIDYKTVKQMLGVGLVVMTGADSAVSAWGEIIRPYKKGDRIVIKPNLNNTIIGYSKAIMTSPQVTQAVVESLLEAGYPAKDITIFDLTASEGQAATAALSALGVSSVFLKERDSFPQKVLRKLRIGLDAPDIQAPIKMQKPVRDSAGANVQCYIPKVLSGAQHLINVPVLKAHQFVLQSSAFKNHFGTVRFSNLNSYPVVLHGPDIDWHIADINANPHVRNKTRLVIVDALLGAGCFSRGDHGRTPSEWRTLPEGRTPASLFLSKDPVAVESVLADLIIREQRTMGYEPHSHRYLHVAAQLGLGTHEHADESGSYTNIEFTKVSL